MAGTEWINAGKHSDTNIKVSNFMVLAAPFEGLKV